MIKTLANFFRKPWVYRSLLLLLILGALAMNLMMAIEDRPPGQPTMLDAWIMRGK